MANASLQRIDDRLAGLDPKSLRAEVLRALRRFRAGWIDLGRMLNQIAYGGDFKDWGYEEFDIYCARELGLKNPTVQKLMLSYNYMKTNEPQRLRAFENAAPDAPTPTIPDYQTVALLSRARQREDLEDEAKADFHRRAFEPAREDDGEEAVLRRELRQRLRPPSSVPWDEDAGEAARNNPELAAIIRTARDLRRRLAGASDETVPAKLRNRLEPLLAELEQLL